MLHNTDYKLIAVACRSCESELKKLHDSVDKVSPLSADSIINVICDCFKRAVSQ